MLYLYIGADRVRARAEMDKAVAKARKQVVRISDANTVADLHEALRGTGMFPPEGGPASGGRAVVLDSTLTNEEMKSIVLDSLSRMKAAKEPFFILEEKPDAATKKMLEKHAESVQKFDAVKARDSGEIFALANALRRGDKKTLWVAYQRALARDEAPEAIHGVLFWGAKDMFLKSSGATRERVGKLIAELAELPHESRRRGLELEYALERFVLSVA